MLVKLTALIKSEGQWRKPGESVDLPETEARRLIEIGAAETGRDQPAEPPKVDVEALRRELARLQEFEKQQIAADADAKAKAEKEEAERKSAEAAAAKGKSKAAVKDDAHGQADGK